MKFLRSRFNLKFLRNFVLILCVLGSSLPRLQAFTNDQERREARVQATYLTHLINFTIWSKEHLPRDNQSPTILVLGNEDSGFVASLDYLISQTRVRIGGKIAKFSHLNNAKVSEAKVQLKQGVQVVFLMPGAKFTADEVRALSPSAVIFGFGRNFVLKNGGDVAFVSERNRVKLVLSEVYFRRTSPKLSSKIANLKSVVEIIRRSKSNKR